jgi:TolB protein
MDDTVVRKTPMIRYVLAAGMLLVATACDRAEPPAELPELTVVVGEYTGSQGLESVRLSPDRTRLLWTQPVDGQGAVFVGNADGTSPVRLTHGIWDRDALWSPTGRWIAYIGEAPDYDVFVVPSDGSSEPRQLTSGPASDVTRLWLPEDSAIAFNRVAVGALRTFAVPLEGGEPRVLGPDLAGNMFVTPSPDGSRWTFTLDQNGLTTIWVQQIGGEPRQLTTEGLEEGDVSMWSPDGRHVAFESRRTGTRDIWIADVETGDLRQLTTDVNDDRLPQWSPDGRWIAFESDRGGQDDIWIVPAAGGQPFRVTNDIATEDHVHWASDSTLYFTSMNDDASLGVLAPGSTAPTPLASLAGSFIGEPDLSPDGRTAIFTSDRSGNLDIWRVSLDGGEPEPLITSALDDRTARFSPDGSRIAFISYRTGSPDVWVVPADGGEAMQLTDWPSFESSPAWSPDGESIVFASNRDTDQLELWIIPASGGEARRLTGNLAAFDVDVVDFEFGQDGRTIYYVGLRPTADRDLFRVSIDGGPEPLGASPSIIPGDLSPDGTHYAYPAIEAGWAFIDVIPTAGGPPRRLTERTERVYQNAVRWSADGTSLLVRDYDYPADTYDLTRVTWPGGDWQPVTQSPGITESPGPSTSDGRILVVTNAIRSRVLSANVASLMRSAATAVSSR